jgi:hypothetical protein
MFFPVPFLYQPTQQLIGTLGLSLSCRIDHDLNIIERRRWVSPHLGYYPGLGEDDQHSVLENGPLSHHLTAREEELLEIGAVCFERLATLLRHCVKGGLEDVTLVEVGSIVVGVSTLHA